MGIVGHLRVAVLHLHHLCTLPVLAICADSILYHACVWISIFWLKVDIHASRLEAHKFCDHGVSMVVKPCTLAASELTIILSKCAEML
eukprot:189838-Chlamydomonas_euryale.AAC.11